MNLRIQGDRSFHVEVIFEFYDVKKLWRLPLEIKDKIIVKDGYSSPVAHCDFTVVGRQPHEIKRLTLEFDGHTVILEPGPDKFADLSPITLYADGRDFWTNQLRKMALRHEQDQENC